MGIAEPAFFDIDTSGWFVGRDFARGPWSEDHCHGGPIAALMARAAEQLILDKSLVRIAVDLHRPVPLDGVKINTEIQREGRLMATATQTLVDRTGRICCYARTLHTAAGHYPEMPTASASMPSLSESVPGPFPLRKTAHSLRSFKDGADIAYPPGESGTPGPTSLWMRTPRLLPNEETSPFQAVCPLADCGNAFSRNAELKKVRFINMDLTITIIRPPESDWLASQSTSYWQSSGVGLSSSLLFDEFGVVGHAGQTILLQPVNPEGQ